MSHRRAPGGAGRAATLFLAASLVTTLVATVAAPEAFAQSLTVTAATPSVAAGGTDAITVTGSGNASGDLVTVTASQGSINGSPLTIDDSTFVGQVTFTAPTTAQIVTITATDEGDSATASTTVDVTAATIGLLSASPASVPADGLTVATITAQITGDTVGGVTVDFATTLGTLSAASANTVTNGTNGTASVTLTSTSAGIATVTATSTGVSFTPASVSITFTAASGSTAGAGGTCFVYLSAASSTVAPGGTDVITVTGVNNDAGDQVTVTASAGSISGSPLTIDDTTTVGTVTFTAPTTGPASVTITATDTRDGAWAFLTVDVTGASTTGYAHGVHRLLFYAAASGASTISGCASSSAQPAWGTRSYGIAELTVTGRENNDRLNVTVALRGALPDTTYSVAVELSPGSCSAPFTVTTHRWGTGVGHEHVALTSGATEAWVTATSASGSVLVTPAATLTWHRVQPQNPGNRIGPGAGNGDGHGSGPGRGHGWGF